MRKLTVPIVVSLLVLLTGCNSRLDDVKRCLLGEEKPIPLETAIDVVKAAGLEVRERAPEPRATEAGKVALSRQFTLLCSTVISGQRISQTLSVDLDAGTVNGSPAQITSNDIKWSTPSRNPYNGVRSVETHTLNRLNGDYRWYVEGAMYAAPPPTYACAPAPAPSF